MQAFYTEETHIHFLKEENSMAVSSKSRLIAVPSIALLSLAVLAGCGSSDSKDSSAASSSATTSASVVAVESSSAAASEAATVEAVIPAGYKQVAAPKNKITFAVPEGWMEIDSAAVANADAVQEIIDQAAAGTNFTADQLKAQMAQLDLMASSTAPNADGFTENVNVNATPVPATSLPTQSDMEAMVASTNGTAGEYKQVDTPLGKGAKQAYKLDVAGVPVQGVFLIVPSGTGIGYSVITVSSSDAASSSALADTIAASVAKAS